jgi:DNA-binding NarL/FixJ family response regulator
MRILVADDHSLFRDGITSLLEAAGFEVVGQVGDGKSAVEAAILLKPDLVVMDISMPQMNGLEALRAIKANQPLTRVVILTVSDDEHELFEAIKAGAEGFLLKNLRADEFIASINGLKHDEMAVTRNTATRLIRGMVNPSRRVPNRLEIFTPRELELLSLMAEGWSNKIIAQHLSISENTVKYHIKKILLKANVHNRTEAVFYAIREGSIKPPAKA